MKFNIHDVTVYFPHDHIYPEQYEYMRHLWQALEVKGHCLLEMPTGTGKTLALLSFITSYQLVRPAVGKLVYCTRTVPEVEKVLNELKKVVEYRETHFADGQLPDLLAVGLSSRMNLCVHPDVFGKGTRDEVDAKCNRRIAPWIREGRRKEGVEMIPDIEDLGACLFYENFMAEEDADDFQIPQGIPLPQWKAARKRKHAGVYAVSDLRRLGEQKRWCPYFYARRAISYANVVVFNYQYLIDPKISKAVEMHLDDSCIVVFDEAHNIDNVALESMTRYLMKDYLLVARRNIRSLTKKIKESKGEAARRLRDEHQQLAENIVDRGLPMLVNREYWEYAVEQGAIPGNIRRAEHFVSFLNRFVGYLWTRIDVEEVVTETTDAFLRRMPTEAEISRNALRFCHDRLYSLLNTLEIEDTHEYQSLRLIADIGTLVGTFSEGFRIIVEPYDERTPHIPEPIFHLVCLDASIAMKPIFDKFRSVVITSGTLSPLELYPKILDFQPVVAERLNITLTRECLCPVTIKYGADQQPIGTEIEMRYQENVIQNYAKLLIELGKMIPDGIVCFFVSYEYMKYVVEKWHLTNLLHDISKYKLPFIETQDARETTEALANYRRACDCGRGAIFFSVARGKVAEGVDFEWHYGRCVVMIGIPYQYTLSRVLNARLSFLDDKFGITTRDYLNFDAVRQAAQCAGRVIRDKADYGMMIFADKRYGKSDKMAKLPLWIQENLDDCHRHLSIEMALIVARAYLIKMAKPYSNEEKEKALLSVEQVERRRIEIEDMDIDRQ